MISGRIPITEKMLLDWAGPRVFRDGKTLFEDGVVEFAEYEAPIVRGALTYGNRSMRCEFQLTGDGSADNRCPCRDSKERGIICHHVVALGMQLVRRATDPERERKAQEEMRRAARLASLDESAYLNRVPAGTPGAQSATLNLTLDADWQNACRTGRIPMRCEVNHGGTSYPVDRVPTGTTLALIAQDDNILFVLEDISEGPAKGNLVLNLPDFINVLNLHQGKPMLVEGQDEPVTVNAAAMASVLRMDLDKETGDLVMMVHTELPFMDAEVLPLYIATGSEGWVFDAGNFWPLSNLLPAPLQGIYDKPVCIERATVPRFIETEVPLLEAHMPVQSEVTPDLFIIEPAEPGFRLQVRGSPASLAATLYATYPGISLVAGRADAQGQFALPDPDDILRYLVRNPQAELRALERLASTGLVGDQGDALTDIVGSRDVLNFLGGSIPRLRRMGWQVDMEGRIAPMFEESDFATPVVRIENAGGGGLFDVGFEYEDGSGASISEADIQRALLRGESYVQRSGRTILLDADAINTARDVFADCSTGEGGRAGAFRMDGVYAAYVKSSLDALDGIDVEAPSSWLDRAQKQNRGASMQAVTLTPHLDGILRDYQKEGVSWLRFLEDNLCGGILADEMGLGKTLQAIAWFQMNRTHEETRGKPALVICPTSLVENWQDEVAKFAPEMNVLVMSGAQRHEQWENLAGADLVVTSYALMRRDIEQYVVHEFSATVLDEAQHIKNHSTQNALAAKRLRGHHRFVLTGTPIENSVSDLWSIMDYLMPGYLGSHSTFKQHYEVPISQDGPEGEVAQSKLRKKLHPFLMRRLKKDVAKDLPPKIERIAYCTLTKDQKLVYKELLEASRRSIGNMVSKQGFQRSRMEILKTLLRLRQVCCHLDLLKLKDLHPKQPSGKMDLFFELMDEALDGGHRVLVFSQFTSMLAILRKQFEGRDLNYCYLDGSTKERMKEVKSFNTNRDIPAFLISLKAGGTGLNLTGADMVIHFDPWWNPAVEDQATDRAHRLGQTRTVYSVKLITRDTVEQKVLAMQKRKKAVIDATLTRDDQVMEKLSWDDVQELLEM